MTKIKEQSAWNQNKNISQTACLTTCVIDKIGGHWKSVILYCRAAGAKRYSELRKAIQRQIIRHKAVKKS